MREFDELTFSRDDHTYRLDGAILPSVTQIMKPLSSAVYETVHPAVLQRAAERGTAVHEAISDFLLFGFDGIDDEFAGYFDAFKKWYDQHDIKIIESEAKIYHPKLLYAGTLDFIAEVDGVRTLIDFKTSSKIEDALCGVQLCAYNKMLEEHGEVCSDTAILHLRGDGKFSIRNYGSGDSNAWRIFLSLLNIQKYKNEHRL